MFNFQNLPPSEKLHFEQVDKQNSHQLYELFKGDHNQFVDDRFVEATQAKRYAQQSIANNSKTYGAGCDWFIKNTLGEYVGMLHLYGMNADPSFDTCSIGFAIAAPFRRRGIAVRAILHLLNHIFDHFHIQVVYAHTHHLNHPTQHLLSRLGFVFHGAGAQKGAKSIFFHYTRRQHQAHLAAPNSKKGKKCPPLYPHLAPLKKISFEPLKQPNVVWINDHCSLSAAKRMLPLPYAPEPPLNAKNLQKFHAIVHHQHQHHIARWWWLMHTPDAENAASPHPIGLLQIWGVGWWYGDDVDTHRDKKVVQKAQIKLALFAPIAVATFEAMVRQLKQHCSEHYAIEALLFDFGSVALH